ncbi:MAG: hypothetical protein EOO36_13185, partial [Cytophagaceae bacterium]
MYLLPLLNAQLAPCSQPWEALPNQPGGRYCARCAHLVHDFSAAADLPAALAAARAAAPGGRLSARLRRFLVALVLVVGLGLSAQEALAQVRRAAKTSSLTTETP